MKPLCEPLGGAGCVALREWWVGFGDAGTLFGMLVACHRPSQIGQGSGWPVNLKSFFPVDGGGRALWMGYVSKSGDVFVH